MPVQTPICELPQPPHQKTIFALCIERGEVCQGAKGATGYPRERVGAKEGAHKACRASTHGGVEASVFLATPPPPHHFGVSGTRRDYGVWGARPSPRCPLFMMSIATGRAGSLNVASSWMFI